MSKDQNIANIIKQLDDLSVSETRNILNYIDSAKQSKEASRTAPTTKPALLHKDKEGRSLKVGDRVVLLTKGVDNKRYEEATVHTLPKKEGDFAFFIPASQDGERFPFVIKKLTTSVRKLQ